MRRLNIAASTFFAAGVALGTAASGFPLDGTPALVAIVAAAACFIAWGRCLHAIEVRAAQRSIPPLQHPCTPALLGRRRANLRGSA